MRTLKNRFRSCHRKTGTNPGLAAAAQTAFPTHFEGSSADNYPPRAHNWNSEPMSNIALSINTGASPRYVQTTRPFHGKINRKQFRGLHFRAVIVAKYHFL